MIVFFPLIYACENMELYVKMAERLNDYFYTKVRKVLFSLGYFDFPTKITTVLHPLHEGVIISTCKEWPKWMIKRAGLRRLLAVTLTEQFS